MEMLTEAAFMEDHTLNPTNDVGLAYRIQGLYKKLPQAGREELKPVTDPDRRARVRVFLVFLRHP